MGGHGVLQVGKKLQALHVAVPNKLTCSLSQKKTCQINREYAGQVIKGVFINYNQYVCHMKVADIFRIIK